MKRFFILVLLAFSIQSLSAAKLSELRLNQLIYERNTDSLRFYFQQVDSNMQHKILRAWGSYTPPKIDEFMSYFLTVRKPIEKTRLLCIWAIGQYKSPVYFATFLSQLADSKQAEVVSYAAEAVGKLGEPMNVKSTFSYCEKAGLGTFARAAFQYTLASVKDSLIERTALHWLERKLKKETGFFKDEHYYGATLSRIKLSDAGKSKLSELLPLFLKTNGLSLSERALVFNCFKQVTDEKSTELKLKILSKETDIACKTVLIRNISFEYFDKVKSAFAQSIKSKYPTQAVQAAETILKNAAKLDPVWIKSLIENTPHPRVVALLYKAGLLTSEKEYFKSRIISIADTASNAYFKGMMISALSNAPETHADVFRMIDKSTNPVILNYGYECLKEQVKHFAWEKNDTSMESLKPFFEYFKKGIERQDDASMCISAEALREPVCRFNRFIESPDWIYITRGMLKIPEQLESKIELQKLIDYLVGAQSVHYPEEPSLIDWIFFNRFKTPQFIQLTTTKGVVKIKPNFELAPMTVFAVCSLTAQGYYNGKVWHRMVPAFVVQTGCPRGDGWRSPGFSTISEYSDVEYSAGTVGMASAGRDTESSQWFISTAPTPHLESRYTIWGEVIEGFSNYQLLDVGDKIIKAELIF